jgi:hypothetical protein
MTVSSGAPTVPLSLVLRGLPGLQSLAVVGTGSASGLADACRIIANLGTRLEALEVCFLYGSGDVSTDLAPLTSLTGALSDAAGGNGVLCWLPPLARGGGVLQLLP